MLQIFIATGGNMKRNITLTFAVAAVLALSGCGGSHDAPEAAPATTSAAAESQAAESTPADPAMCNDPSCDPNNGLFPVDGKYEFTSEYGTTGAFEFDSKAAPKVESLRKAVGAKPVHYMTVKVDNRKGSEFANMYTVTAYDPAGKKYEYTGLSEVVGDWGPTLTINEEYLMPDGTKISEARYDELNSLSIDLENKQQHGVDVSEVATMTLVHEGNLPRDGFTRVNVQAHGGMGEGVDAYLEGQEPPMTSGGGSGEFAPLTMDECIANLAEVNAEVDGVTAESLMNDPELEETCVGIVATQGGN